MQDDPDTAHIRQCVVVFLEALGTKVDDPLVLSVLKQEAEKMGVWTFTGDVPCES